MLISFLGGCQDYRAKKGGTWRMLMVPDKTLGGKRSSLMPWMMCFYFEEDTLKISG